jgi:hypothetical protein
VALRPRLSPGGLLSRCGRYGRAGYRDCQSGSGVEPETWRGAVRVNPAARLGALQTQPRRKGEVPAPAYRLIQRPFEGWLNRDRHLFRLSVPFRHMRGGEGTW